jgi:hypothetical protein
MQNHERQIVFTGEQLADTLHLEWPTLYKKMTRMGYNYTKDEFLPEGVISELIADYAKPHPKRDEQTLKEAQHLAVQYNIINITHNFDPALRESAKPSERLRGNRPNGRLPSNLPLDSIEILESKRQLSAESLAPGDEDVKKTASNKSIIVLIYAAFIAILLYQIEHLAAVGMQVSAFPKGSLAGEISGWLFACTVAVTALVMTLKRGIKAKITIFGKEISYLLAFAFLDVIFFILSTAPLKEGYALNWVMSVLVGVTVAFVIYSFNELVTTVK